MKPKTIKLLKWMGAAATIFGLIIEVITPADIDESLIDERIDKRLKEMNNQ